MEGIKDKVGVKVGTEDGTIVGSDDAVFVGPAVGAEVAVGALVGFTVDVGATVTVGASVGTEDGTIVGDTVFVGPDVGTPDGSLLSATVGVEDGKDVACAVGEEVGAKKASKSRNIGGGLAMESSADTVCTVAKDRAKNRTIIFFMSLLDLQLLVIL